jgi:hypothetical protein
LPHIRGKEPERDPSPHSRLVHAPPPTPDAPTSPEAEDIGDTHEIHPENVSPCPTGPKSMSGARNSHGATALANRVGGTSLLTNLNPALVLENSGSVARDHLASERTFLAYVRTSLTIATTGVGIGHPLSSRPYS